MIELVSPGTHIDFIGRWKIAAILSTLLIAAGLAAAPSQMQMGIDFAGGWEIQVRFGESLATDEAAIRDALSREIPEVGVVRFGSDQEFLVRFAVEEGEDITVSSLPARLEDAEDVAQEVDPAAAPEGVEAGDDPGDGAENPEHSGGAESEGEAAESAASVDPSAPPTSADPPAAQAEAAVEIAATEGFSQGQRADQIRDLLRDAIGPVSLERVEFVGPRVGAELRRAGIMSLLIAGGMILLYITFRFTFRFAPGAIVALLHDVLATSAIWVLMGREFNLQVLAALLAIVGYSLNDTIIVYDRIRENMELRTTTDLPEVLNRSINQTLSRTVLTSATTLLAVLSLLVVGGEVIRPFAAAMAIGILIGTYSSVFIAAPVLLWLESRHNAATA